ncbi:hypothetical protein LXL04_014407 [Taraxacum kok-saghyz]
MYTMRADKNGIFNPEFQQHVKYFLDFAYTNANNIRSKNVEGETVLQIRCPCSECKNRCYKKREMVAYDIYYHGFMGNYSIWYAHGESFPTHEVGECSNPIPSQHVGQRIDHEMAQDIDGEMDQDIDCGMDQDTDSEMDQDPNQTAEAFYALLRQSDVLLWDGFEKASKLSTTTRLLNWKSDCIVSDSAYDKLLPIFKDSMPDGAKLPTNFYETKKILKPLELPSEQIHVCLNHCMLFYGRDSDLDHCRICNESRYDERGKAPNLVMTYMPIGPRLQRLFYSKMTAQHLTWHADHRRHPEKMIHPSEGRAWNHFDSIFPDFAKESRNVRLGLCTDDFNPNSSNGKSYSCWPVFVTVYNLPPWLALKERYIQIPIIIPGPKYWDTPEWRRKSEAARANRMSGDSAGKPRHTGGSMGYDEHRIRLEKQLNRPIMFHELFLHTHLTKKGKKMFWAGDYDTIEGLEFCTSTSREAYAAYARAMIEKFGRDLTQHPVGDVDVWLDAQRKRGKRKGSRIYGVGCSDPHFVITGTSSSGNAPTFAEFEQSQRRVQELEEIQAQLEAETAERQSQFEARMAEERAQERAQLEAELKAQMNEFMKTYALVIVQFILADSIESTECRWNWSYLRHLVRKIIHGQIPVNLDKSSQPSYDGRIGCQDECLNRMLNIECVKGTCPCGDFCSNQQFQKRKYSKLKCFPCGKKGFGLQLQEDIPKGT